MLFRASLTRRDALLLLLGATLMHVLSLAFPTSSSGSIIINTHSGSHFDPAAADDTWNAGWEGPPDVGVKTVTVKETQMKTQTVKEMVSAVQRQQEQLVSTEAMPLTSIVHHAPGWTLFRNLYMSGGTLYIVNSDGSDVGWPGRRMMTSPGLAAENTPENMALREPTEQDMRWISREEAIRRWGSRIRTVQGNTVLVNEPSQFLRHYYHLVAELFFGIQSFWWGTFNSDSPKASTASTDGPLPDIDRIIFAHSNADGWRDGPGFNAYFMRAAFPSITVEVEEDWQDRVVHSQSAANEKVFLFPLVLLTDRSASHRGVICGSQTQRIAAEAHDYMQLDDLRGLAGKGGGMWWESVRQNVLSFAGIAPRTEEDKVVITYVSRQGVSRRKLTADSHDSLVTALQALVARKNKEYEDYIRVDGLAGLNAAGVKHADAVSVGKKKRWELTVMAAETMNKDAQIAQAAKTTVMLGVHGNGLSHLLWMPQSSTSVEAGDVKTTSGQRAVIELFYPGGFAHDYHWTSRALGHAHYAVWNDTWYTHPDEPGVDYPEGFQENYIPVHGETVAMVVERHVDGLALETKGHL